MRLPRRHPFASHGGQAEVSHLYSLFYPSPALPHYEADAQRAHGVHLVQSLYLPKGGCPVAIECTSSMISSLLLDHQLTGYGAAGAGALTPPPAISLAVRQTLTLSLIRLVNTLADSLQKGAFARSIASIAERELGLPQWFVEFRHRGTHEELPSLEICREVVGSALAWIEGAYWLPTLRDAERRRVRALDRRRQGSTTDLTDAFQSPVKHNDQSARPHHQGAGSGSALLFPSSASQVASSSLTPAEKLQQNHIPTLHGILRNYKRLSKALVRDESLRGRSRAEMQGIYRDLDHWMQAARKDVGEGYRALALTKGMDQSDSGRHVGWAEEEDDSDSEQDEQSRGRSSRRNAGSADPTLECLIGVLLSSSDGVGLIPLSKSKRAKRARSQEDGGEGLPNLPEELLLAWSGLLSHLGKEEPAGGSNFVESWLGSMIELLLGSSATARGDLEESTSTQLDGSSRLTLLAWIKFILDSLALPSAPSASNPPTSTSDEVTSHCACIRARLLTSSSGQQQKQEKERQAFLLSLAERLLLQRGAFSTSHSQSQSQAQAQAQASLAALLRDVTARLDEATRARLQSLVELLPPAVSLNEDEGEGEGGGEAEGARKKRRLPSGAELLGEGEDSFPLLSGFEEMDSGAPPVPPPAQGTPSTELDAGTAEADGGGGGASEETLMEEMERRWRQVLASSSSSSAPPSSSALATAGAAPATSAVPPGPAASLSAELLHLEEGHSLPAPPSPASKTLTAPLSKDDLASSRAPAGAAPPLPLPQGWSLFPSEQWRATPIGMIRHSASRRRGHEGDKSVEEDDEGEKAEGEGEGRAIVPDFLGLFVAREEEGGVAAGADAAGVREEMAL